MFVRKGGLTVLRPSDAPGLAGEMYWDMNYLTVPLTLKLHLGSSEVKASTAAGKAKIGAYVKGGTELGVLLSSTQGFRVRDKDDIVYYRGSADVTNDIAKLDCGILFAAGFEPALDRLTPYLELSYAHGLLDIHELESVDLKSR